MSVKPKVVRTANWESLFFLVTFFFLVFRIQNALSKGKTFYFPSTKHLTEATAAQHMYARVKQTTCPTLILTRKLASHGVIPIRSDLPLSQGRWGSELIQHVAATSLVPLSTSVLQILQSP